MQSLGEEGEPFPCGSQKWATIDAHLTPGRQLHEEGVVAGRDSPIFVYVHRGGVRVTINQERIKATISMRFWFQIVTFFVVRASWESDRKKTASALVSLCFLCPEERQRRRRILEKGGVFYADGQTLT
mgnify:CR=1 FL=1